MPHTEAVRADLIVEKVPIPKPPRLRYTVNSEVKAWIKVSIKEHWYFYQCPITHGLRISFCSQKDAMMWKLAWH